MSEVKQLTAEELEDIKSIKQEYSNLSLSLGEIELSINNLNNQKQYFLEIHKQLFEKENELAKILNEKYGIGTINIETGVIE
jgi:fido (protein-threonine AMPylation protein)